MKGISTDFDNTCNIINLKEISVEEVRNEIFDFMLADETILQCFQTVRDQVIFTNKRVVVINVQGISEKKASYISYPYSKVIYFGVETAGALDTDCEFIMVFPNNKNLKFEFMRNVDIKGVCRNIQQYIL